MAKRPKMLKKDYAYSCILEMIKNGRVTDGKFPSEPEFCKKLQVSRVTLRSALKQLEKEGLITRSHYYGTRVASEKGFKKLLIATTPPVNRYCERQLQSFQSIEEACRKQHLLYESCLLWYLQAPEKLAEKYNGIVFFGAAIRGDEPFLEVLRKSGLPILHCREDENNPAVEDFSSIGINMKKAFMAGLEYLESLGYRKIMTFLSSDERSQERLGFSRAALACTLKKKGLSEAARLIVSLPENIFDERVSQMIREKAPEAIYCYSDYFAVRIYEQLRKLGKKIPEDVAVMGFGGGSEMTSPTLSSVSLVPPHFGQAVISLLEKMAESPDWKPFSLDLPFQIHIGESTARLVLNNLIKKKS